MYTMNRNAQTRALPAPRLLPVKPKVRIALVGGFRPTMREADDDAIARCQVVVDTHAGALAEAGDLTQPLASGRITRAHVVAELAQLLRGELRLRGDDARCTLFKSVGTALEDLAGAQLALGSA